MQEPPSDAIRTLLMKKKREQSGGAAVSPAEMDFAYKPPNAPGKRERPEDAVPDYPQNRLVREFLKRAPAKGGKVALGEGTVLNQCWRCKLYGHRTGDRSCPYFTVGNLEAEAERQIREDPLMAIAPPPLPPPGPQAQEKLQELNELLETVKRAEEERKRQKRESGKDKKNKKKKKKKKKKRKGKKEKEEEKPAASWL